jgi:hypothetical protein
VSPSGSPTAEFTTASTGATVTSKQTTNKPSADAAAGNDGDGDTARDSGAVVGAVVGALAAVAMVIAAAVMILQRRRPEEHDDAARPTAISNADFDGGESGEGGDGFGTWPLKRVAGSVHATDLAEPDYDGPAGDDMCDNTAAVPEPVCGGPTRPTSEVYQMANHSDLEQAGCNKGALCVVASATDADAVTTNADAIYELPTASGTDADAVTTNADAIYEGAAANAWTDADGLPLRGHTKIVR